MTDIHSNTPHATTGYPVQLTTREPHPADVSFLTTEHFTLQGARAATVSEATGRAGMFLSAVSGGLISLGLMANAVGVGTAFYCATLIVLTVLTLVGYVTFARTLQSGVEDHAYARRIARLRAYYFDQAPELCHYLLSVPAADRVAVQGLFENSRQQKWLTVSGMVAIVTAAIVASAAAVVGVLVSHGSPVVCGALGFIVFLSALWRLVAMQQRAWELAITAHLDVEGRGGHLPDSGIDAMPAHPAQVGVEEDASRADAART